MDRLAELRRPIPSEAALDNVSVPDDLLIDLSAGRTDRDRRVVE